MADPLRRTLLAKLRGKKTKKGATLGGAAANGSRGGKENVLRDPDEALRVVVLTGMDWTAERLSTYENCVEAEGLAVVSRRTDAHSAFREEGRGPRGPGAAVAGSPRVQMKHFVSVPRQRSVGDSIGFGDSSCHVLEGGAQVHAQQAGGPLTPAVSGVPEGPELRGRGLSHMAGTAGAGQECRSNRTFDSGPTLETNSPSCLEAVYPKCAVSTEESVVIRTIESYGPDCLGDTRETAGSPQSPAFFPTELHICNIKRTSLCSTQGSRRYPLDSEDDDYYDNEILPFYETARPKTNIDRVDVEEPGQGKGHVINCNSAHETDRLRNQLQEAYYLLINAMNDISLDFQQIRDDLAAQQATSSCSSHSRDSLCSRLSVKNMDSDSWSSGGNHSSQHGSDTESLLLCLTGNLESKSRLTSKSMSNLSLTKRPAMLRSASDGAIRYQSKPSSPVQTEAYDDKGASETLKAAVTKAEGLPEPYVLCSGISSEELRGAGGEEDQAEQLNESSSSVNSLTGSSDSNTEVLATHQGQETKQEQADVRTQVVNSANKAHGVTVNKMQEWMHKGRLLSSEMKQRIEGSSLPRGGGQTPDRASRQANLRAGTQTCVRGGKSVKTKSSTVKTPRQLQPAFIENFQAPCANGCEVSRSTNEAPSWRPQHTTITVSKKRNWLQQSSQGRGQFTRDDLQGVLGAEEEGSQGLNQLPPPPSPSPDHLRHQGGAPPRPVHLQLPQVTIGQAKVSPHPRSVDPAEENDADDEGEIWYNPIPEDEEPGTSRQPSVRLLVPPRTESQRRPSRGVDVVQDSRILEGSSGPEGHVDILSGSSGDGGHSAEAVHVHRQMLACKPQEEGGLSSNKPTDALDLPIGFSPPSSPNPTKKCSSINWSFPDKIKSPRTVRKISMKISRKLSVKGTQSNTTSSSGSSQLEPRAHSPRANGSGSEVVTQTSGPPRLVSSGGGQSGRNVISRYHLDSSVSTQHSFSKKKSNCSSKSAIKGGYLSDGDSPELVAKSGKHSSAEGKGGKGKETELDIDAFRHYSFTEQPKCSQYISGLMSLHFYGAEDLKPPRVDSRDVYCAIQVDSVNKARTALLTCRTSFLDMDHTFNIELENAQHLKLVVFSWEPTPKRNRVCCHGTVMLPTLFRVTRTHQLAVKLEPRGLIYVKLNLMEHWQNSLNGGPDRDREPQVFGVEVWRVVERENAGLIVPLIISKCINEIEQRGCQVVGLYRLCGSAAVKKELREAFERDSHAVELCESMYPDVNVITGVLKDYLRELPYPLINKPLYEAVLDTMAVRPLKMGAAGCENDQADSEYTVRLLENLPEVERMTLRKLLDHLKRVASYHEVNKMTCQNLAVCFGPVLLSQRQEASCHTNRVFIDSEELASALHFKKHIEVLHYLLQLWPVVDPHDQSSCHPPAASVSPASSDLLSAPPLRRRKERPQVLNFSEVDMAGVLRPKPGRLDSPSNRYAGDWSTCGENYFPSQMLPPASKEEVDYDDVPSEDTEEDVRDKQEDTAEDDKQETVPSSASDPAEQENPQTEEVVREEEKDEEMKDTSNRHSLEEEEDAEERRFNHILLPRLPKEHAYQAYMKIQDMSPVLSNRGNLRDLQESIDTLIGNLERELNKNKLNVGY